MVKRTKKTFRDYNEYHDRPFGLKWGTAYALDELMKGIKENESWATKEVAALELMNQEEIDLILSEAFLYHKPVSIQLNTKDEFGRFLDPLEGLFLGEAYDDYFVVNDRQLFWSDVRHIEIKKEKRWYEFNYFENKKDLDLPLKINTETEVELIQNEYYQPFIEEDLRHEPT